MKTALKNKKSRQISYPLIKLILFLTLCSFSFFGQVSIKGPWTIACGISANTFFSRPALNLRLISPRFKWSDYELTADEEKRSEQFRNTRLMMELTGSPPSEALYTSFNVQSRLLGPKRLSLDIYGGMKFFWVLGKDFVKPPDLKAGRVLWYMNLGLLLQVNLGVISPFADIGGGDGILTIGTELNFFKIHNKSKRRSQLKSKAID